jgi:DNA-binding response OmpR family regulator
LNGHSLWSVNKNETIFAFTLGEGVYLSMGGKKIILFIDDNPVDRTFISRLLTKYDFYVLLAEDGNGGLKMAQEEKPDLIILDILLPHISGIELCKKIKQIPAIRHIPVIFYTSMDAPKHLIDYTSYGAKDYIPKTMPPGELVASIRSYLN